MTPSAETSPVTRPRVVLITHVRFWHKGFGTAARLRTLARHLALRFDLSVAFLDALYEADVAAIREIDFGFRMVVLGLPQQTPVSTLLENFRRSFDEQSLPAVYILEQTEFSFMRVAIPSNGRKMLDTHDLISARTRSMMQFGAHDHTPLNEAQEAAIFREFDDVLFIQPQELATARAWIGDKALLVPHPVVACPLPLRDSVRSIGLVASQWHANVDGLRWFIEHVWPHFRGRDITLDLYGYICKSFSGDEAAGLRLHGFQDNLDDCYADIDIVINPVRYGAGLKIKSVEALARGLPSVFSTQGASGIEDAAGNAFLPARDAHETIAALEALIDSPDLRRTLGQRAGAYAAENFSAARCFGMLDERIREFASAHA